MYWTPRYLELFVKLGESGSMTDTAAALGMTQPAVSQQLQRMERALGIKLFTRHARGVSLSSGAEPLFARALEVTAAQRRLELTTTEICSTVTSTLRVGCVAYGAGDLTSLILREFRQAWPACKVVLSQTDFSNRLAGLDSGIVDIIFTLGPLDQPWLDSALLFSDPIVVAVSSDTTWAQRTSIQVDELLNEPILSDPSSEDDDWNSFWLASAHRKGRPPTIAGSYSTPEMHLDAVAMGQGISFVTSKTAELYHRSGVAYVPVVGMQPVPHWIAWRKDSRSSLVDTIVAIAEVRRES